jgi:phosphonate transport system permease protein
MKNIKDNSDNSLLMAIAPASDNSENLDFENLVLHLKAKIGLEVIIKHCKDYSTAMKMLSSGEAQIGWLGGEYANQEIESRYHSIEEFAVGVPMGKKVPFYRSQFIVSSLSEILILEDVRNKNIALGDVFSTSGYEVPRRELSEVGIDIKNENSFNSITHVSNHDQAILEVISGKVDVAPVSSVNLESMISNKRINPKEIRIIHQSPNISGAPLVYLQDLDPILKEKIKSVVLDSHNHIDVSGYGGHLERYVDPLDSHREYIESYLKSQWGWRTILGIVAFLIVYLLIIIDLEIDFSELLTNSFFYMKDVIGRMLPPDFSNFKSLMTSMLETVEIAMLGTLLAIVLSIPVALLSARNLAPNYPIYLVAKTITIFFRAIPEFIMAMILVIAIGFGAMPGVIALGFHTMGFLAKFYAESIEHVNEGPIQALESMGASKWQVVAFAVVPQIIPSFIGNNLYILDRNIRMATMLGIVGAGGIGYELQSAFRMFEYPRVAAIIIVIFMTIFIIDMLSSFIRSKVL